MQDSGISGPQPALVFVGREPELAALRRAWTTAGGVVVVRGPAGIGKTRLIRELGSWSVGQGGRVLSGRATAAGRATPLRPVREALLGAARRGVRPGPALAPFVPTLSTLVPEWATGTDGPGRLESTLLLGEALLRLLTALAAAGTEAGRAPTTATLVLDDLQWADPETLTVVEYLADNVEGSPVLVVATIRDGEPGEGTDLAGALVRRRAATELVLPPLAADDVLHVARACLGDNLPDGVSPTLVSRSEGVPFLVEELVATAVSAGWDSVAASVPGSVVASVELRLDALPDDARRLLVAAALAGRLFDWSLAARAAGLADDRASELLRHGVRLHLVDVEGAGFRFRHALTRDAVLAATPPAELAVLARRALAALAADEAAGPAMDGDRCLLAAELAERADRPGEAAALVLRAAELAKSDGALASAELFAGRARELAPPDLVEAVERVLLEVRVLAGDTESATALGTDLLARVDDRARRAEVHLLLGSADLAAGRWEGARSHAAAAAVERPDATVRARAHALAAHAAMGRDDVEQATARAREALEGARATGQLTVQCEALEVLGRAERGRDLAAAETAFQEAYDIADRGGLALWRVRALQELGTVDLFEGLAVTRLQEARRQALALGAFATAAVVDLQLAALHDERGELREALAAAERCGDASRRLRLSTLAMSWVAQGMVHARRGDRSAMDDVLARAVATGEDPDYVEAGIWGNVTPIAELVSGDLAAAADGFERAMVVLRRRPALVLPFPGLWALLRTLLGAGGTEARAEVAALPFDTPVSRRMLVAADAVALGAGGDPVGAATRFAEADRALVRHNGAFRQALIRLLVAPAAHRDGWGEPAAWLRESLATFDGMELEALGGRCRRALRDLGEPVPRRRTDGPEPVPPVLARLGITGRELDVLVLVAGGLTNREVAERLFISARTVDKHVERLLLKTGTTRRGLAPLAREAGLLRT